MGLSIGVYYKAYQTRFYLDVHFQPYQAVRGIEVGTMGRGPGNASCGLTNDGCKSVLVAIQRQPGEPFKEDSWSLACPLLYAIRIFMTYRSVTKDDVPAATTWLRECRLLL